MSDLNSSLHSVFDFEGKAASRRSSRHGSARSSRRSSKFSSAGPNPEDDHEKAFNFAGLRKSIFFSQSRLHNFKGIGQKTELKPEPVPRKTIILDLTTPLCKSRGYVNPKKTPEKKIFYVERKLPDPMEPYDMPRGIKFIPTPHETKISPLKTTPHRLVSRLDSIFPINKSSFTAQTPELKKSTSTAKLSKNLSTRALHLPTLSDSPSVKLDISSLNKTVRATRFQSNPRFVNSTLMSELNPIKTEPSLERNEKSVLEKYNLLQNSKMTFFTKKPEAESFKTKKLRELKLKFFDSITKIYEPPKLNLEEI